MNKATCQDCLKEYHYSEDHEDMEYAESLVERVAPGEHMPAGQCPSCGALCTDKEANLKQAFNTIRQDILKDPELFRKQRVLIDILADTLPGDAAELMEGLSDFLAAIAHPGQGHLTDEVKIPAEDPIWSEVKAMLSPTPQ